MSTSLEQLYRKEDLSLNQAEQFFEEMLSGELPPERIAAALIALKMKGEKVREITGLARTIRLHATKVNVGSLRVADCCGTGGDGLGTFNVSTASSIVAATCGLPMVKHGNRSVSSTSGSADMIERLGIPLMASSEQAEKMLAATSYCFLFAPHYHPLMKHVGPVRQALATSTIFNLAGPLANPAEPKVQLMGVPKAELVEPIAEVLSALGCERALVVHGKGLDELALHGDTTACLATYGKLEPMTICPADAGLDYQPLSSIQLNDDDPYKVFTEVLAGQASEAKLDMVAFNTGALLWTAELASSIRDGYTKAREALDSGAVLEKLEAIRAFASELSSSEAEGA